MIAIVDNDVILKLARWDLLDSLVDLVGGEHQRIHHLSTCVPSLCGRPNRMRKTGCDEDSATRIREFCARTNHLIVTSDPAVLELLSNVAEIDVGEVQIFAVASCTPKAITFMCDKRSLVALAEAPSLKRVASLLEQRVKCLEQVMAELMMAEGLPAIGRKVLNCTPPPDKAISIAFSQGPSVLRDEIEVWEALESYYRDLKSWTGDLLAPFPVSGLGEGQPKTTA